jgi:hypothetical protein
MGEGRTVKDQDEDKDRVAGSETPKGAGEAEEQEPRKLFKQVSHIAIAMSYDLIDKLRFYEKETLKLSDKEVEERIPHMQKSLERLRVAYIGFAEVDF